MLHMLNYGHAHHLQNFKKRLDQNQLGNMFLLSLDGKIYFLVRKKNNLNGFRHYWYDFRKDNFFFFFQTTILRQFWDVAGFAADGATRIVSNRSHLNSEPQVDMLVKNLLPEAPLITNGDYFNKIMQVMCLVHHVHGSRPIL